MRKFDELPLGSEPHHSRYLKFIQTRGSDREPTARTILKRGFERHHIFPLGLGGQDTLENLIYLTPREHFIAHLILWKCYGKGMSSAFWYLAHKEGRKERLTSRQYEILKKNMGVKGRVPWNKGKKGFQAAWNKGLFGATHPNRKQAIRKPQSEETKRKIGAGNKGKISWSKGKKKSEETLKKMKEAQVNRRAKEKMNVSND